MGAVLVLGACGAAVAFAASFGYLYGVRPDSMARRMVSAARLAAGAARLAFWSAAALGTLGLRRLGRRGK